MHLIREQIDAYARSLSSIRHIKGDQILHDELRPAFQPTLTDVVRGHDIEAWTPHLEKLNLLELEHREKERQRDTRRQKRGARNNRRNVVTLPDRDPVRTARTILPRPGAQLDVPDMQVDIGEDAGPAVARYETATPFPLVPVTDLGPAPQVDSPMARRAPKPAAGNAAMGVADPNDPAAAAANKPTKVVKRRGRLPAAQLALEGETGGLSAAAGTASPAAVTKKIPSKKLNNRPGWTRTELTTKPNIIDGKWHCTSGFPTPSWRHGRHII